MVQSRRWAVRWRRQPRIWMRRASRSGYNLALFGFALALGSGALAWLYLAPPSPPIRLSAAAAPQPPWHLAAWRMRPAATRWAQTRQLPSGESLREFLRQQNIRAADADAALGALMARYDWGALSGGEEVTLLFAAPPASPAPAQQVLFDGFSLSLPHEAWMVLRRAGQWQVLHHVAQTRSRLVLAEGVMESDLYISARRAGLPPPLAERWLRLLTYRLHAAQEDWRGGQLQLIYRQHADATGRWRADGELVFFALQHNRQRQEFWRLPPQLATSEIAPPYVNARGESLALTFLRTPLSTLPRFSPTAAQQQFAAPPGTRVLAAAAGIVLEMGDNARDGRFVRLQHENGYESFYAGLHEHARTLARGRKVQQGEPLGTLGLDAEALEPRPLIYRVRQRGAALSPAQTWPPRQVLEGEAARQFAAWRAEQEKLFAVVIARQRSLAHGQ